MLSLNTNFPSFEQDHIWSFAHNYFNFDPMQGDFNVVGIEYQWNDGIFSITMGRRNEDGYRSVFFHPMVSVSEFVVNSRILQNETASQRSHHGRDFRVRLLQCDIAVFELTD